MQTCPLQTIPYLLESIHFFKALLYEEYYADMSPSDDPSFRWNPFTFFKALLYEEYYADMSPSDDPLFRSNPFTFF